MNGFDAVSVDHELASQQVNLFFPFPPQVHSWLDGTINQGALLNP